MMDLSCVITITPFGIVIRPRSLHKNIVFVDESMVYAAVVKEFI